MPPFIPHRTVITLIVTAILLPIAICVILGVASLLIAMGDAVGGAVLRRIALAGGIAWAINLIGLLLALAVRTLERPDDPNKT